jgi:hypothetical protein
MKKLQMYQNLQIVKKSNQKTQNLLKNDQFIFHYIFFR